MQTVDQWMTQNPYTIEADASIIEAMHLMKEKNIRRLPVTCKGTFCGLITDLMIKSFTPGQSSSLDTWEVHYILSKATVKDAMNPQPFTITPEAPLYQAAQIIRDNKLNGLCVTDSSNRLVGLLTTTNLMEALISICGTK
ncbi:CBS domain-containing protein [Pelotalea chapellei]|uniref:CBS domain-containing protein n=1 Tax=Pelotalea chapellei TaxID=44671 RepID=A0ABS5U3Z7_9BACT|nr:CBS domain-containing protein [Pelotalea chapellei]MBT1070396.1 CBS domain-containing protein [Pelotalea chapellei]